MSWWRIFGRSAPQVEMKGAEVSVTVERPPTNGPKEDAGHRHSRLWICFLKGAIADLEAELARGLSDARAAEIREQLADKRKQVAIHEAMHPDASRDEQYLAEHVAKAKGMTE